MPIAFPPLYDTAPCYLVAINRELIPYVAGLLKIMEKRGFWLSNDDYERGYNAVVALEGCMMAACLNDLFARQDALYRMLDTALYGTEYTIVSTDPLVVTPDIPAARAITFADQDSLLGRADRIVKLVDNAVNGATNDLYSLSPSVKDLLQGIIDALGTGDTDLGDLLSELEIIAALLA